MNNYEITDNDLYKDYDYLYSVIDRTLAHEKVENAIFSIIFVTNEEIHEINKEYRGIDRVTDVISFALEDSVDKNYNGIRVLGDIYICIPRMKEQANEYGHSEKRELSFLTVHGLLHLLGYDHMEHDDEVKMFSLQEEILNEENIKR
jgi:probable rRNA maturation factor